ncbi:MAG TPA: hypothetical protein DDW94_06225 [Deltaproteobacteria bacterium]|nr:MAG: hypothetical protein A2Z79_00755 [Deltaproteobacteria bacterium GWA2_55_82]HBG46573.1 hypothetical protein [Deltaproteobacteria bacterium]HCY09975.1 hypothetical protein [Deltaproteobacteria bacterium]
MALLKKSIKIIPALLSAAFIQANSSRPAEASVVETLKEPPGQGQVVFEPEKLFGFAQRMKEANDLPEAKRSLGEVHRLFPETVWAARASFLLGLIAIDEKDPAAIGHIERAQGLEDIGDYLLFYKAEAFFSQGRFDEAASAYGSIITIFPGSMLVERATFLSGLSLFNAADYEAAGQTLERFVKTFPKSPFLPEALFKLADSYIYSGKPEKAIDPLKGLAVHRPASSPAIKARGRLSLLEAAGFKGASLTDEERFRRAEAFSRGADFDGAAREYERLLDLPAFREKVLFKAAVANARLKLYARSEKLFNEYLSGNAPPKEAEALYWLALSSVRQGREEGLLKAEKRLAGKFPSSEERAKVLMLIGREKEGTDPEGAQNAYRAVLDNCGGSPASDEAFWKIAWVEYTSGGYDEAMKSFSIYAEAKPFGKEASRFKYWKGRSAQRAGRLYEAADIYEEVCAIDPGSFYCLLSAARSKELNGGRAQSGPGRFENVAATVDDGAVSSPHPAAVEFPFAGDPRYRAGMELLALGLRDEAAVEIEMTARNNPGGKAGLIMLANLLYEARDFYRAYRLYRSHLSNDLAQAHLGFPLSLVDRVRQRGAPTDPFLVAAVAREESHFNPAAVSPVGAMGLMQIMPSTGSGIARELGVHFDRERLLEADTSIRFGSWYLDRLLERFNGDLALTVAGYNAGPNAAARWARTLPAELDEFVESIPYGETRAYTKRVLRSYAEFLRIAGEDPLDVLRRATAQGRWPGEVRLKSAPPFKASSLPGWGRLSFFRLPPSAPFQ